MSEVSDLWGAMPPPIGVEPNFHSPPDQKELNIACHAVCLTLVTLFLAMRLYTRYFVTNTMSWDDGLLTLSFILTVAFSGMLIKSYEFGIGRHMWDVPAFWIPSALRLYTIAAWIYTILGTSYRLAILAVYYRIFTVNKRIRGAIIFGFTAIAIINLAFLFVMIYACNPPDKAWDALKPGECRDPRPIAFVSGALNVSEDLYVLVLPLPTIHGMKMRLARKLRLLAVFGLGVFALVASIIRLSKTQDLVTSKDTTRNFSEMGFWAVIEVNVSMMCACLAVLPAFIEHHWPKAARHFNSGNKSRIQSSQGTASVQRMRGSAPLTKPRAAHHSSWTNISSTHTSDENLTANKGPAGRITVTQEFEMDYLSTADASRTRR
ncbi:hypothetical protein BDV95DRAFT_612014 [Massariosphaeria phaeospora]|uniref:Rhodopsin domain-containing protein n=1 Tax=Massariosphaeria phaeospora TaxID=100035 RepID=A0A7C8MFY2_9PLEO|nr:hypothetical protein BDV95DRAFT_612014 [Massariosphaeria phaeospora]